MKKTGLLIGGIIAGLGLLIILSQYMGMVGDEEGINAQDKIIDLTIDKMVKKIQGQGYVVKNFAETIKEVLGTVVGEGGRAAAGGKFVNAVSERYPEVPQRVWVDLAQTMSAEYESMFAAQATKADKVRVYKIKLRNPFYFIAKKAGGFPTIDMVKADQLITGADAQNARKTGTIETVDPFKQK